MKNIKKVISVVLAVAMIFSMGFTAFAYKDVAEGTKVEEAVGILSNLGIFTGFEDGTFRPNDTVTRAQMAAIICRTLGYEEQAQASAGSTVFNDVRANNWASGYINVAQSLQIVNGYGNGKFGPNDPVTYEQAIKMIVVALGYELDAQAKGGWSTGYLAVAAREGISKGSNGVVGAPAARGTIAVLVYNSLEVRLMDQKTWGSNGDGEFGKTDETILSQYLGVEKWEGVVSSVPYFDYAKSGYEEDADQLMSLSDAFHTEYQGGKLVKNDGYISDVDCSLVPDVNAFVGKKVVAYIGAEEDDNTGNRMVYAIAEKQGANKVTKISAAQLVETGEKYYNTRNTIGYRNVGTSRIDTVDLDSNVEVIVNFGAASAGTVSTTAQLESVFEDGGGTIEFISNDSNSKVDYILATVYDEEAVIEEVDEYDEIISFNTYTGTLEDIDMEDEDTLVVVIRDGKVASVKDIEEQDTVSIVGSEDFAKGFRVLYVSSKVVAGRVDSYYDDIVSINNDDYEISPFLGMASSDLSGEEGVFFLNVDGQIAWADSASSSSDNYALLIAAGTTSGLGGGYEVEVVLGDGTVAQYKLNSKAYIESVDGTNSTKSDSATYNTLKSGMGTVSSSEYRVKAENLKNYVFEIVVKNNKITKLKKVQQGASPSHREYDEENMCYGSVSFDESTVVYSVEVSGSALVGSDDVNVGDVSDFFVDGEGERASIIAFDENTRDIAGVVLGFGLTDSVPQDNNAFIISSVKNSTYDDYDAYVVTGMQGGRLVSYTICDEDEGYTGNERDLAKGNVILLGVVNSRGIVSDFETLYSVSDGVKASDNSADEIYYIAGNLDESKAPSDNKFYLMDNRNLEGNYYDEDNGISMRNSANYTLVDYSEGIRYPEISKKSKSKNIFGSLSKYDSVVFVRYYNDELREVVVYRYNNGDIDIPTTGGSAPVPAPQPINAPTATPVSGEVAKNSTVALAATTGATIYYTTDGTVPTTASTVYSGPIVITENVTIKTIAVLGEETSDVATFVYAVPATTLQTQMNKVPSLNSTKAETVTEPAKKEEALKEPTKAETVTEPAKKEEALKESIKAETVTEPAKKEEALTEPTKVETVTEPAKKEEALTEPTKAETVTEPAKKEEALKEPTKAETVTEPAKKEDSSKEPTKAETVTEPEKKEEALTEPTKAETVTEPAKKEEALKEATKAETVTEPAKKEEALKEPTKAETVTKVTVPKVVITDIKKPTAAELKIPTEIKKVPAKLPLNPDLLLDKSNINKATVAELSKLDGITEAIATKIVEYRTKNGDFKTIEDLKKVDGVTEAIYDKIKEKITV